MKCIVVILSVVAFAAGVPRGSRVWGGQIATSGQFPYVVAIDDGYGYQTCGGVIIAPNWILTAAQCLFYLSPEAFVNVGTNNITANGTTYRISHIIAHEGYDDDWSYRNDIGLIKFSSDLVFSDTVRAIEFSEGVAPNATCTVVGWGETQGDFYPELLSYADVTAIDMALCQNVSADELWDEYLGPEQLCTLAPEGRGACYGDTGGPLVCDGKLAGIVSYTVGYTCATEFPDVYTSIPAYLNWILAKIQP